MTFLEAQAVLSKIKYKRARFYLGANIASEEYGLRITMKVPCIKTGLETHIVHHEIILGDFLVSMNERAFVNYIREKCTVMELHEVDEWFQYDGMRLFDPHKGQPNHIPFDQIAEYPPYDFRPKLMLASTPSGSHPMYDAYNSMYALTYPRDKVVNIAVADTGEVDKPSKLMALWKRLWK